MRNRSLLSPKKNPHPSIHFAQHCFTKHSGRADLTMLARGECVRSTCIEPSPDLSAEVLTKAEGRRAEFQKKSNYCAHCVRLILFSSILRLCCAVLSRAETIPVFHLTGALEIEKYTRIMKSMDGICRDEQTRAIIIHADSGGGVLYAPFFAFVAECNLRKPIWVIVDNICASACYDTIVGAHRIIVSPIALIGSVGVITERKYVPSATVRATHDRFGSVKSGLEIVSFLAGKDNFVANMYEPISDAERRVRQESAQEYYQNFIDRVRTRRSQLKDRDPEEWADAHLFSGTRAYKLGLVDRIGSLSGVLDEIAAVLKVNRTELQLKDYFFD